MRKAHEAWIEGNVREMAATGRGYRVMAPLGEASARHPPPPIVKNYVRDLVIASAEVQWSLAEAGRSPTRGCRAVERDAGEDGVGVGHRGGGAASPCRGRRNGGGDGRGVVAAGSSDAPPSAAAVPLAPDAVDRHFKEEQAAFAKDTYRSLSAGMQETVGALKGGNDNATDVCPAGKVEVRAPAGDGRGEPARERSRAESSPPPAARRRWDVEAPATGGVPFNVLTLAVVSCSVPATPAAVAPAAGAAPAVAAVVGDGEEEDEVLLADKTGFGPRVPPPPTHTSLPPPEPPAAPRGLRCPPLLAHDGAACGARRRAPLECLEQPMWAC